MQTQTKKKQSLKPPAGMKEFVFAAALVAMLFGWQAFAQNEVTPPKAADPKVEPQENRNISRRALLKPSAPQAVSRPRPTPIAVTRSSR